MTLFLSPVSFFIYASLFLFALKIILPYCCSQFMLKYFCKKRVLSPPFSKCGLGLITNETTASVNPNVIESSSLLLNIKPMTPTTSLPSKKKDPGGIGFIDDMGSGVDGLMSCTESLGFESCDERRVDDGGDDDENDGDHQHMEFCEGERDRWRRKKISEEKRSERNKKKFPPPLSSLNQNGQPCFYLKPVRKNGKLEITEVRIQRPEILRAVRQNGRLRLHLVSSDACPKINEGEEDEDENEETKREEQEQLEFHLQEVEEEGEKKVVQVSGEGRRCHELVMSHHHHDYPHNHHHNVNDHHSLHLWRQPFVTTR
ncbi:uncharacterized protein LOC111294164 [Durio zibethinus]|uniref:Uncharacterized protein LOC111294164 n=1 Tax=Durio zibethinus TaxID=66656 RepID=A0A6P5YS33_DURZI|nr:uncharacterized protein LOC111294164 [Durio zibethinus]